MIPGVEVKRIKDDYFIVRGCGKLRTRINLQDIKDEPKEKTYKVNLNNNIASITLSNGRELSLGYHSNYIRRYFEV